MAPPWGVDAAATTESKKDGEELRLSASPGAKVVPSAFARPRQSASRPRQSMTGRASAVRETIVHVAREAEAAVASRLSRLEHALDDEDERADRADTPFATYVKKTTPAFQRGSSSNGARTAEIAGASRNAATTRASGTRTRGPTRTSSKRSTARRSRSRNGARRTSAGRRASRPSRCC